MTDDVVHMTAPCAGPAGATLCFKIVEKALLVPFLSDKADCPKCVKAAAGLRKATTNRGVLKKGYGQR